ncbi:MAG: cytochrome c peroxidase [Gimesia sp.]|nr:cytochrome c peroxidase [Gimesia sp.]
MNESNIRMKPHHAAITAVWILAMLFGMYSGPWSKKGVSGSNRAPIHDENFHMHDPLHDNGKVSMAGQFHLELISHKDGKHRMWVSNAFRQEMDPAGFHGVLKIESPDGHVHSFPFERVGRSKELIAQSHPLKGQVWLTIDGMLGQSIPFHNVKFFWDHGSEMIEHNTPLGLDSMLPVPINNPMTAEKVELGRELFFDTLLSVDNTVSCATCHRPDYAFAEPLAVSKGVGGRTGQRNTPTVLNTAYLRSLAWDGRAPSLEEQTVDPLFNHVEMGMDDEKSLLGRLESKYGERFQQAFGGPATLATVTQAISCFERTLLSGNSKFDRFEAGDQDAIPASAQRGRSLFFGKARCGNCHIPPLFTDHKFHHLGVSWTGKSSDDRGRFEVTGNEKDLGAFKTPSLRDVSLTSPYMHDGSIDTLRGVLEFYNRGGQDTPHRDSLLKPLDLSLEEINDLLSFLKTLEGQKIDIINMTPKSILNGNKTP